MGTENGTDRPPRSVAAKANRDTPAARFNTKTLRGLGKALKVTPEADLASVLQPEVYSKKLLSFKAYTGAPASSTHNDDLRSRFDAKAPSTVVREPSPDLKELLRNGGSMSEEIMDLLNKGKVLYRTTSVMVVQVSENIVAKVTIETYAATEYDSLSYLQQHLPHFPSPKPHGVMRVGQFCVLFTSIVPGTTLEIVWPRLDDAQKSAVRGDLDAIFSRLRSLPRPKGMPLGGVGGEGCKDARRGLRVNPDPIMDANQFEDFIFAGSKTASPAYTRFLRGMAPKSPANCVFTHGDFRPANVIVEDVTGNGTWTVVGVLDWESSGFYPEYWESVKITNNLTAGDSSDWYLCLPDSISPHRYAHWWLLDRVWDRSLDNS